jgi:membrane-associated phospholipid phosphatase
MNTIRVYNFISFSTIVFPLVFLGKYLLTSNNNYLLALGGLIFTNLLSEFLKYNIFCRNTRPALANNCNLNNNDGQQGGKPGMPSSHAAITTYFVLSYISIDYSINNRIDYPLYGFMLAYLYLVLLSRYRKHCHSIEQLIAGFVLGASVFVIQQVLFK